MVNLRVWPRILHLECAPALRMMATPKNDPRKRPIMNLRSHCLATLLVLPMLAQADPAPPEPHRHVNVSGRGEVATQPDRARLQLGVTQVNPDLSVAEKAVNTVVRAYLAEAKALGARDEQISTAGISIQPEYQWDEKERINRLIGYRVSRDIEVRIDDLDKLGDFVLRATRVGVNQVQAPQLESSKADALRSQALVAATLDAQAKARLVAQTLGLKLGPVHVINAADTDVAPPRPQLMAARADAAFDSGNQELGFSAGEIRYSASVNAEFDLLLP